MSRGLYRPKVVCLDRGEIEVVGNRVGLKDLAAVCQALVNCQTAMLKHLRTTITFPIA